MKLNNEMCEMSLNNERICTIYNDDYVILRKSMPVIDERLGWYIDTLKFLKQSGVNISPIVDYRLLPETKRTYDTGSYTQGIFLEERAKGKSLDSDSVYLRTNKDYDFNKVICKYLGLITDYVEELELRASASQEMYDKLVIDCQSIQNSGLEIDPKPLNFFFDKNQGFIIIDVVQNDYSSMENYLNYFPQYMFGIVFGFGKPSMSIDFKDFSILSQDMIERLNKAGKILEAKIVLALRKYGFSEEKIQEAVLNNRFRYLNKLNAVEVEDMEDYIAQNFMKIKEENEKNKNDSDNITFSW